MMIGRNVFSAMKKLTIGILVTAAVLCSCSVEPVPDSTDPVVSTVRATMESPATKAELDASGDVLWTAGDEIYVKCSSWEAEYLLDPSSAGSTSGIFTWDGSSFFNGAGDSPVISKGLTYSAYSPDHVDTWKTQQSYSETLKYIPMKAETVAEEDGSVAFEFNNLGGVLRLTVKGSGTVASVRLDVDESISGDIVSIEKGSDGKFIAVMASSTHRGESYVELNCGDGVALSDEGAVFYFSIPCCTYMQDGGTFAIDEYTGVTITLTDTQGYKRVKTLKGSLGIERSKITDASFSIPGFVPDGGIDSKFTVNSAGDKVCFSQGNLYWDGDSFEFETNQYDFPSTWNPSHVGHFYWSKTPSVAYAGVYSDAAASTSDVLFTEATGFTANSQTGTWRTLTLDEWAYLFSHNGYALAKVNEVPGAILFCDGYTGDRENLTSIPAGCVFLPSASYRIVDDESNIYIVTDAGVVDHWSSTPDSADAGKAGHARIVDVAHYYTYADDRNAGFCIRLVHDFAD